MSKGFMNRLKARVSPAPNRCGALPLRAFYGRDAEAEAARTAMYENVAAVFSGRRRNIAYLGGESAALMNTMAAPLEHLVFRGEMETAADEVGVGGSRYYTALRMRELFQGAQVRNLKSPSLEGAGGGGFGPAEISSYQLDCVRKIEKLRAELFPSWVLPLVEAVIFRDEWLGLEADSPAPWRHGLIACLHYALDRVALVMGYEMPEEINRRWAQEISPGDWAIVSPQLPAPVLRRIRGSRG